MHISTLQHSPSFVTQDGCSSHKDITGIQDNKGLIIVNAFSVSSTMILNKNF